jgi:hypothetical protein
MLHTHDKKSSVRRELRIITLVIFIEKINAADAHGVATRAFPAHAG